MREPSGFMWHRQVPETWSRELATLTPISELVPYLHLAWLPGDPWGPVQRWSVYEMVPLRVWWSIIQGHRQRGKVDDDIWEWHIIQALQGPNPRDLGHYDAALDRFISTADVTRQEWELFREHKAVPKIFWVIQGDHGGHKRFFTKGERDLLRLAGLPEEPPVPGSLPYAPFDTRVLHMLARHDRFRGIQVSDAEQAKQARKALVDFLHEQMGELAQSLQFDLVAGADVPDQTAKVEAGIDRYIETGSTRPQPKE